MEKYIFSGGITNAMADFAKTIPIFKPMDVLVSWIDESSLRRIFRYHHEDHIINSVFVDSAAFSVHTGIVKEPFDEFLEKYIAFINEVDDEIDTCAQMDTIPGKFKKPKSPEDYVESAEKSWENYLYMRTKIKSPEKITPVFHFGEDFKYLRRMLEWRDENGKGIPKIGISPANDTSQGTKNLYLERVYDIIKSSSYPDVKTHLYGMTSLDALTKFPCYSADSVSHRLMSAYNKIYTRRWGTISLSDGLRSSRTKSNMSFVQLSDDVNKKALEDLLAEYGTTIEEVKNSNAIRAVICICEIQRFLEEHPYDPKNLVRPRKLFQI